MAALITAQLIVTGVAVVAVFFGPWIVGPHDPLRSGIALNVTFGVAVGSFVLATVGSLLRYRRRRSSWWVPCLGGLITAVTALTALDYLAG
ncbi:DUF6264 family protein [Frondihabitans sp. VKM Ac-2883]|uniref:DUF6264 family protein n=1 Tax=Frondihabitans sp. VKM Ac-2883 TaxID=2783823 RepID=UPI00188C005A|nr:DUF6264 family protein [Frondihabitans sp. VKM Ac-2883]MBF4574777.1 hypothetical protein [Frondihabitans sp. VKM Ac-2883]